MDSVRLDALDRQLLHALHVDGRAPFSALAEVLDVSDRTVARRIARLRTAAGVRVTGLLDRRRIGKTEWMLRLRVRPGAAPGIAHSLARRSDTSWVTVAAGGTEVLCMFHTAVGAAVPVDMLARHTQILDVQVQQILRHLTEQRWRGRTSALAADQVAALASSIDSAADARLELTELDYRLAPLLAVDGRAGYPELARRVDWSESAVRRRIAELRRIGLLRVDIEVDATQLGFPAQCLLWLAVIPSRYAEIAQALATDPETAFIAAITGSHNLFMVVVCSDTETLFTYLTARIGALDAVTGLETVPTTAVLKRAAPVV